MSNCLLHCVAILARFASISFIYMRNISVYAAHLCENMYIYIYITEKISIALIFRLQMLFQTNFSNFSVFICKNLGNNLGCVCVNLE